MYDRILVGTDGSDGANRAVTYAIDLAEANDATLHVLTAIDPRSAPKSFGVETVAAIDRAAEELIDAISSRAEGSTIDIVGDVHRGEPATILLSYAEEKNVDLIVTGQRGHSGLTERILGSTPDRIARKTERPFLIIP